MNQWGSDNKGPDNLVQLQTLSMTLLIYSQTRRGKGKPVPQLLVSKFCWTQTFWQLSGITQWKTPLIPSHYPQICPGSYPSPSPVDSTSYAALRHFPSSTLSLPLIWTSSFFLPWTPVKHQTIPLLTNPTISLSASLHNPILHTEHTTSLI